MLKVKVALSEQISEIHFLIKLGAQEGFLAARTKKEIIDCYESRKFNFKRRGYTAAFVREMHDKYPIITSIKTIEKLVTSLNKKNEQIPS
jgi:hypothetical protein